MPPRVSHLPNHAERSALDKLRHDRELSLAQLHPTGSAAVRQTGEIIRFGLGINGFNACEPVKPVIKTDRGEATYEFN
jgi:hypothetical protein